MILTPTAYLCKEKVIDVGVSPQSSKETKATEQASTVVDHAQPRAMSEPSSSSVTELGLFLESIKHVGLAVVKHPP